LTPSAFVRARSASPAGGSRASVLVLVHSESARLRGPGDDYVIAAKMPQTTARERALS
jgi:hypothetical protein